MCIIFFSYQKHSQYPLIVAANRDEFYNRPTAQANFWEDHPNILAGRDLEMMGTWLGITKNGRFAALTNYRDPSQMAIGKRTRGELVSRFLTGNESPKKYLQQVKAESGDYNGFNLLLGNHEQLYYYSSQVQEIKELKPGIYGLSNALLNTPWPKVERGKHMFQEILEQDEIQLNTFFHLLRNNEQASDRDLPNTGVGRDRERILSPIFIQDEQFGYGTRSSTLLRINNEGHVSFTEKTYNGGMRQYQQVEFSFDTQDCK